MAAARENRSKTSLLNDDGTACGEIAAAPVAEPTGVEPDVLVFRDGELAFRAANVVTVETIVRAEIVRSAKAPTVSDKLFSSLVVLYVGGEFEGFTGAFRSGDEANEFARFAPEIFFAAPFDVFQSAGGPVGDGSENGGGTGSAISFPEISDNRLAGRQPLQIVGRNREALGADVLAKGEKRVMPAEIFNR